MGLRRIRREPFLFAPFNPWQISGRSGQHQDSKRANPLLIQRTTNMNRGRDGYPQDTDSYVRLAFGGRGC